MRRQPLVQTLTLIVAAGLVACGDDDPSGPQTYNLAMTDQELEPVRTVPVAQDLACGGEGKAGGEVGGTATITPLGESEVEVSAAWDVANLLQTPPEYTPEGPAGGPVAPVLGQDEYPYTFAFDPGANDCGQTFSATGKVVLTPTGGGSVLGDITGGEAHRLDFAAEGDGVETFAEVTVTGGTGQYEGATGSFVVHTIVQFQPATLSFDITEAEILPGGTLHY